MKHPLTPSGLRHYGAHLSTFAKVASVALLLVLAASYATPAFAQTVPSVTFGASVTNANGSLATKLTWSTTPTAKSCTASGHASWTGTKAASGTADLPAITLSGTYALALACTWDGDTVATLTWVPPTTNSDGTALAKCATATTTGPCLAFYRVLHSTTSTGVDSGDMTPVNNPNATSYVANGLPAGPHFWGVEVVNGNGVPSALSNVATKTITASTTKSAAVTLTVNPIPGPATNLQAN